MKKKKRRGQEPPMSKEDFCDWLVMVQLVRDDIKSDAAAARELGIKPRSLLRYKRGGAPCYIALACSALIHNVGRYRRPAPLTGRLPD